VGGLLELERSCERVRHRRALLKTIAWRRAADTAKQHRRVVAVDPAGLVLENVADVRAQPDEEAQRHLDGGVLRLVSSRWTSAKPQAKLSFAQEIRYAIEPGNLHIGGRGGAAMPVGAVIRLGLAGARVWLTTADLSDPDPPRRGDRAGRAAPADDRAVGAQRPPEPVREGLRLAHDAGEHPQAACGPALRDDVGQHRRGRRHRLRQTGGSLARVGR
jgi:hypothetical protein